MKREHTRVKESNTDCDSTERGRERVEQTERATSFGGGTGESRTRLTGRANGRRNEDDSNGGKEGGQPQIQGLQAPC